MQRDYNSKDAQIPTITLLLLILTLILVVVIVGVELFCTPEIQSVMWEAMPVATVGLVVAVLVVEWFSSNSPLT